MRNQKIPLTPGRSPRCSGRKTLAALLFVGFAAQACGDEHAFEGNAATHTQDAKPGAPTPEAPAPAVPGPVDPVPKTDLENRAFESVTWYWQCETDPTPPPVAKSDHDLVIEGIGPHQLLPEQVKNTPVTIQGRLCPPQILKRDVVIVIDTSGSMTTNDPRVGTSCGRLTAVRQVLLNLPAGTSQFALVTFNSDLGQSSSRLFDNANLLFAELAGVGNIADVVCDATGGTNYDAGLTRASALLQTGRTDATKEIYFVSDGQPDAGNDGVALAAALKSPGVAVGGKSIPTTIATVMLNGTDKVLETQIASKDSSGKALYVFVANTQLLAQTLSGLADNSIVGATLGYRAVGAPDFTQVDLLGRLDANFNFKLPSINVDLSKAPNGIEVQYSYYDKHDNHFTTGGKLVWSVNSGAAPVADGSQLPDPNLGG